MNEITVTIPLSLLSGVENLTPEGISRTLTELQNVRAAQRSAENQLRAFGADIRGIGQGMQHTLDSDTNLMDKFSKLRELANKAEQLGRMLPE